MTSAVTNAERQEKPVRASATRLTVLVLAVFHAVVLFIARQPPEPARLIIRDFPPLAFNPSVVSILLFALLVALAFAWVKLETFSASKKQLWLLRFFEGFAIFPLVGIGVVLMGLSMNHYSSEEPLVYAFAAAALAASAMHVALAAIGRRASGWLWLTPTIAAVAVIALGIYSEFTQTGWRGSLLAYDRPIGLFISVVGTATLVSAVLRRDMQAQSSAAPEQDRWLVALLSAMIFLGLSYMLAIGPITLLTGRRR